MNMKKIYLISLCGAVIVAGVVLYTLVIRPQFDNRMVSVVAPVTIKSTDLPLEFSYPSGDDGYTMIEPPVPLTGNGLTKVYIIMDTRQYLEYQSDTNVKTVPPSISVFVFQTPESLNTLEDAGRITRLQTWAESNAQYSSFPLMDSEFEVVELDGVQALRYRTLGMFKQEVYLAEYRDHIYVFTGQFEDNNDSIHQMFANLVDSIVFN